MALTLRISIRFNTVYAFDDGVARILVTSPSARQRISRDALHIGFDLVPYTGPIDASLLRLREWLADCRAHGIVPESTYTQCLLNFEETTTPAWYLRYSASRDPIDLTERSDLDVLDYCGEPWALRELLEGCADWQTPPQSRQLRLVICNTSEHECFLASDWVRDHMVQGGIPEQCFRRVRCTESFATEPASTGAPDAVRNSAGEFFHVTGVEECSPVVGGMGWYMFAPPQVMPPTHPLLERRNWRYPPEDPRFFTREFPGRPCTASSRTVGVWVPVYDTETWEATPAPRLAREAETMMSASFAGGLIADSAYRDILNQFLDNTIWERVGVLPKDTTLLEHEKVTL